MPSGTVTTIDRLRELIDLLEACAANRRMLDDLTAAERERLHRALAEIANPDPASRRLQVKALMRARKAERARKDDSVLDNTGIRAGRRRPVVTTPNVFPPRAFQPFDLPPAAEGAPAESAPAEELVKQMALQSTQTPAEPKKLQTASDSQLAQMENHFRSVLGT